MSESLCRRIPSTWLLTVIIFYFAAYGISAEQRSASSSLNPRKPPFNGSIFGKRSVWNNLKNLVESPLSYTDGGGVESSTHYDLASLFIDSALNNMIQQDALSRASISHCLNIQQASVDSSEPDSALCASLLGNLNQKMNRYWKSIENNKDWFNQLMTSAM